MVDVCWQSDKKKEVYKYIIFKALSESLCQTLEIFQTDQLELSGVGLFYFAEGDEPSVHHGRW